MGKVSSRIIERRKMLNLRQNDLATLSGISQAQISRYESGSNEPSSEALIALASVLDTSVDWLLGVVDDPNPSVKAGDLSNQELAVLAAWRRGDKLEAIKVIINE